MSCILRPEQAEAPKARARKREPRHREETRLNIEASLARMSGRAVAPWGELCCAVLLQRSLQHDLPAVNTRAHATLRLAVPADIDEISRLWQAINISIDTTDPTGRI